MENASQTSVGAISEPDRLVLVLQEVLDVSHLVMRRKQPLLRHFRALFDPARRGTSGKKEPLI